MQCHTITVAHCIAEHQTEHAALAALVNPPERNLNIRVSDAERAMLVAVAEREGLTASAWLRRVIRMAYADAFGDKPSPKKKP